MIIGLTGGIGSGKSMVAKAFGVMGCMVFNSDDAAREIYFDTEVKAQVIALLGKESYAGEKVLNKAFIGSKIFSDTVVLHQLNAIIHPAVRKRFEAFVEQHKGAIIMKESALLFEAKLDKDMDRIVLVVADDELRISRVMQRDGLSREDVLKKIKSQLPQEEKIILSDHIIRNNEQELVIPQVMSVLEKLKAHA
ncbi:MAG: dephospho-CoA kinase [Bacteroidetes bacterium]|nr:dephospho-CoA kinase [Bacteroidota bacterium]